MFKKAFLMSNKIKRLSEERTTEYKAHDYNKTRLHYKKMKVTAEYIGKKDYGHGERE